MTLEPNPALDARQMLRHTVAALAYRAGKSLRDAPSGFAETRVTESAWTASETVKHMGDVMQWACSIARGEEAWVAGDALVFDAEVERFFGALGDLDRVLGGDGALGSTPERLFQGPIADALTHVGQLATLRRLAGSPVKGENYHRAEIEAGRVGLSQSAPGREFD